MFMFLTNCKILIQCLLLLHPHSKIITNHFYCSEFLILEGLMAHIIVWLQSIYPRAAVAPNVVHHRVWSKCIKCNFVFESPEKCFFITEAGIKKIKTTASLSLKKIFFVCFLLSFVDVFWSLLEFCCVFWTGETSFY